MHKNPVKSTMDALHALEHHVRMAFGDSREFHEGSEDSPLQGLAQGHGAAPAGWVSVSSPPIEMMRKEGHGLDSWTASSNAALQLACFAFVDNAHFLNTL